MTYGTHIVGIDVFGERVILSWKREGQVVRG